jgi:hypothetical protein
VTAAGEAARAASSDARWTTATVVGGVGLVGGAVGAVVGGAVVGGVVGAVVGGVVGAVVGGVGVVGLVGVSLRDRPVAMGAPFSVTERNPPATE